MSTNNECIDLSLQSRWRVFRSQDHASGSRIDPWNLELRGPGGSAVYPAGGSDLAAFSPRRGLWSRLETIGHVTQRGDFELTIRFSADRLEEVATLLRCFRRRTLSPERRTEAAEHLRRLREGDQAPGDLAPEGAGAPGIDDLAEDEVCTVPEESDRRKVEKLESREEGRG